MTGKKAGFKKRRHWGIVFPPLLKNGKKNLKQLSTRIFLTIIVIYEIVHDST